MSRYGLVMAAVVAVFNVWPAMAAADTCDQWVRVRPHQAAPHLFGLASNGTAIVAVGADGTVLSSPDGLSWTARSTPVASDLHDVLWTGARFVAVGDGGVVLTSATGVTWSIMAAGGDAELVSVADNGAVLAAVSRQGDIWTSADGSEWTSQPASPYETELVAVASDGAGFVAAGHWASSMGLVILYSADGSEWSSSDYDGVVNYDGDLGLMWDGTRWILVPSYGSEGFFTSADGVTWQLHRDAPTLGVRDLASNGRQLVGVGSGWVFVSSDQESWTGFQHPLAQSYNELNAVLWTGERFLAVGYDQAIVVSDSGARWDVIQDVGSGAWSVLRVIWDGERYLAVTSDARVLTSSDGVEWNDHGQVLGFNTTAVAQAEGELWAVGYRGFAATSSDGLQWSAPAKIANRTLYSVAAGGGTWVAVGQHGNVATRTGDGAWQQQEIFGRLVELHDVVWNGSMFVAVGWVGEDYCPSEDCAAVVTSADGGQWDLQVLEEPRWLGGVVRDTEQLVAAGTDGMVATSTDGFEWQVHQTPVSVTLRSVAAGDGELVAVGDEGVVLSSSDGRVWAAQSSSSAVDLRTVVPGDAGWVAAGSSGTFLARRCDLEAVAPVAAFHLDSDRPMVGVPIPMVDDSSGLVKTWQWSFGDGSSSTLREPVHVWLSPGAKVVNQSVCNNAGCDQHSLSIAVEDGGPTPFAAFDWQPGFPNAGETVLFQDLSCGNPVQRVWAWADGSHDADRTDTEHVFAEPGVYEMSLTARGAINQDVVHQAMVVGPMELVGPGLSRVLRSLTFAGGRFVGTSPSGTVLVSTDGTGWRGISERLPAGMDGLAHGNGVFVGVGASGMVVTSTDAVRWQVGEAAVSDDLHGVAWTGSAFVAGGDDVILTSPDGLSWSEAEVPAGASVRALAAGSGVVVAVGEAGSVLSSADGSQWQTRDTGSDESLVDVVWNGSVFVAVGTDTTILQSIDAVQWTVMEGLGLGDFTCVAWTGARFVAATNRGSLFTSLDGLQWTDTGLGTLGVHGSMLSLASGNGRVIGVVEQSTLERRLFTSDDDAVTWSEVLVVDADLRSLAYNGKRMVTVGDEGAIATSSDGSTWTVVDAGLDWIDLRDVTWGLGRWVAVGWSSANRGMVVTSTDAADWEAVDGGGVGKLWAVDASSDYVVAVGINGAVLISRDGRGWFEVEPPTGTYLADVACSPNRCVVVGKGSSSEPSVLLGSADGTTWQAVWTGDARPEAVTWTGRRFVVTASGLELRSADGVTWTEEEAPLRGQRLVCLVDDCVGLLGGKVTVRKNRSPITDVVRDSEWPSFESLHLAAGHLHFLGSGIVARLPVRTVAAEPRSGGSRRAGGS